MGKELFKGVGTAIITPFKDGNVDYKSLKMLAEYQVGHGADAIVVCGTTGEASTLSSFEKLKCIATVAEAVQGRVPVIAGTGSNDTAVSSRLSKLACREGADAVLAVAPYYNRPMPDGLAEHFIKIAEACNKPILIYNIPSRTGVDISEEVYERLAEFEFICGVKEASGNISKSVDIIMKYKNKIPVYSGNDDLTLPLLSVGAKGVISVASNLLPLEMHLLCSFWFEGKYDECVSLYYELLPFMRSIFKETNPIPIKAIMEKLEFCEGEVRLPLTKAKKETVDIISDSIRNLFI